MSIFTTLNSIKRGNQKITENFLRTHGFKKTWWGSLCHKHDPRYQCWEAFIENESDDICLFYFPSEFIGYVTFFNMYGKNPAGFFYGWGNGADNNWHVKQKANCKMDYMITMDEINNYLNSL